jgi:hypothetical protein
MISLCPTCHAKVERTQMVFSEMNPLLLELWREKHPQGQEQFRLEFEKYGPTADVQMGGPPVMG